MPSGMQQRTGIETESYGGVNTALQFSQIPQNQSPRMQNAWMPKIGAIGKRPGTAPVTTSALAADIKYMTLYRASASQEDILAASGTTLYKYNGMDTLTAQTMTNALNTSDIYTIAFTDAASTNILFITDGLNMKQYTSGSPGAVVNITPAANDPSPAPSNIMGTINTKGPKYCWVYSGHVFVSDGSDTTWYSKRFTYNYFPQVQYERWVRNNDIINGCGVTFDNACFIPMRRGWGLLRGSVFDDGTVSDPIVGNLFLNTVNGVIAPRSIQIITYPNGYQTIAFLSDDGVHEIYIQSVDGGSKNYATRPLMQNKIDFEAIGLTEIEKQAAVGYFDTRYSLYFLSFVKSGTSFTYVYDLRNSEWYTDWIGFNALSYTRKGDFLYFAGTARHLNFFDDGLYSDWTNSAKTSGSPVHFKRYSPALSLEFSGYESYWDYYLIEAKQWNVPANLDVAVIFTSTTVEMEKAIKSEIFVWSVSKWKEAKWANLDYTDVVQQPNELTFHKKAKYAQVLWENNRNEPCEIYKDRWKGRISGR